MSILDILLVIPLTWGAYRGFSRGFFREISGLAGMIAGIFIAVIVANTTGKVLSGVVDWNPIAVKILAFVITYILVFMFFSAIGRILEKVFKMVYLGLVNRIAGLFFGILKYAFILSLLFILISYLNKYQMILPDQVKENSYLYELIEPLAPMVIPNNDLVIVPENIYLNIPG